MKKEDETQLTLRIPKDVHTKIKILGAIDNKSMKQVIVDLIRKAELQYPDFEKAGTAKTIKAKKRKKPSKPVSDVDMEKLKSRILKFSHDGVSRGQIAKQLTDEGIPTLKGGNVWHRGTIGNMLDRWKQ
jgi:hypothetical protein